MTEVIVAGNDAKPLITASEIGTGTYFFSTVDNGERKLFIKTTQGVLDLSEGYYWSYDRNDADEIITDYEPLSRVEITPVI